jgi:hypothetical protein
LLSSSALSPPAHWTALHRCCPFVEPRRHPLLVRHSHHRTVLPRSTHRTAPPLFARRACPPPDRAVALRFLNRVACSSPPTTFSTSSPSRVPRITGLPLELLVCLLLLLSSRRRQLLHVELQCGGRGHQHHCRRFHCHDACGSCLDVAQGSGIRQLGEPRAATARSGEQASTTLRKKANFRGNLIILRILEAHHS